MLLVTLLSRAQVLLQIATTTLLSLPQLQTMSTSPLRRVKTPCAIRGATNATVAAAAGNDTIVAALTLANSSIESAAGADSLSFCAGSSTIYAGSGADSINLSKTVSSSLLKPR